MGNESIEHRRTVHGGDDSALSVELSPFRFDGAKGCNVAHEDDNDATGFAVYIRNPLAFHVQDFDHDPLGEQQPKNTLGQAKLAAFNYADALANHLGCNVDSNVRRPGPVDGPLHQELTELGFLLEGGGAAPSYYCWPARFGDVRVTGTDGGEIPEPGDWLIGVYKGSEDGAEFFERELVWSVSNQDGHPLANILSGAVAFAATLGGRVDSDLAEAAESETCGGCGRASIDCSRNPCADVMADREESHLGDWRRFNSLPAADGYSIESSRRALTAALGLISEEGWDLGGVDRDDVTAVIIRHDYRRAVAELWITDCNLTGAASPETIFHRVK